MVGSSKFAAGFKLELTENMLTKSSVFSIEKEIVEIWSRERER